MQWKKPEREVGPTNMATKPQCTLDKARSKGKRGGGPTTNEILLLTDEKLEGLPWAAVGRKWWTMRISTELRNLPGIHTLYIIHYTFYIIHHIHSTTCQGNWYCSKKLLSTLFHFDTGRWGVQSFKASVAKKLTGQK